MTTSNNCSRSPSRITTSRICFSLFVLFLIIVIILFFPMHKVSMEKKALENLILDYIKYKEQDFQSETHLNTETFFVPEILSSLESQTFWKVFRFEKLVRLSIQDRILWESFDATIQDIQILGSTATVQAFEVYEYQLAGSNGAASGRGTTLFFSCEKVGDKWLIRSIETDNQLIEEYVSAYSTEDLPELAGYPG